MQNDKQVLNLFKTYMVLGPDYQHGRQPKLVFPKSITHLIMQYAQYEDWMKTANDLATLLKRKQLDFITQSEAWAQDPSLNDAKKWLANPDKPRIMDSYDFYEQSIMPLLKFIAKSASLSVFGETALMRAAIRGHTEALKALLAVPGIDAIAADTFGNTALIWAASLGKTEVLKALLEVPGIDVNAGNLSGSTALMGAARNGHTEVHAVLLKVPGIDVNAVEKDGWTTLMYAARTGHIDALKALLTMPGIDANAMSEDGSTATMLAAFNGHTEAVNLIKEHLAHLERINPNKCTLF